MAENTADFEALFQQNWTRLNSLLFRLTGDYAEAEDLALEAFWRLWQRPPGDRDALAGWLYRVALNLGYNALRARSRRQSYEWHAGQQALQENSASDPARQVEAIQERRRVQRVLSKLEPRQAQLLVLRYSGFSYREISAALQVSTTSVGTLLVRAEKAFVEKEEEDRHAPG